nr:hypothetical protein CFP56_63748 [Quercus suber]
MLASLCRGLGVMKKAKLMLLSRAEKRLMVMTRGNDQLLLVRRADREGWWMSSALHHGLMTLRLNYTNAMRLKQNIADAHSSSMPLQKDWVELFSPNASKPTPVNRHRRRLLACGLTLK